MTKEVINKRIKELAIESGIHTNESKLLHKFAELIVKECIKAADEGMAQVTMKVEWPSYHIKKHFGVEL